MAVEEEAEDEVSPFTAVLTAREESSQDHMNDICCINLRRRF